MTKKQLRYWHNYLWLKYKDSIEIIFDEEEKETFYSVAAWKQITIPAFVKKEQSEWSLFSFLHEIGHVMTNTDDMVFWEMEYLASKWAVDKAKELGIKFSYKTHIAQQDYIYEWWQFSKDLGYEVPPAHTLNLYW